MFPLRGFLLSSLLMVSLTMIACASGGSNRSNGGNGGNGGPIITTVAGGGPLDGPATRSAVGFPSNVATDPNGDIFFSDNFHDRIRKIDTKGNISTIAGTGTSGYSGDGGPATAANIASPAGLAADSRGNVYFVDTSNNRLRRIDASGTISTVAGNRIAGFSGDGGPATNASVSFVNFAAVAVDGAGNLFIADSGNFRIRKVDAFGMITTIAGTGTRGFSGDGGPALKAQFELVLCGITIDAKGNIYVSDCGNSRVRRIDANGIISTFAGTGLGNSQGDEGPAVSAPVSPNGISLDFEGNLYVTEPTFGRVRRIDTQGIIHAFAGQYNDLKGFFAGDGGPATGAVLNQPNDVALDSAGNAYIADSFNYRIRKVDTDNIITTAAGTGAAHFSGDGASPTAALLDGPRGVAVAPNGTFFISDTKNGRIRQVSSGTINTIVAVQIQGFELGLEPGGLSLDSAGVPGVQTFDGAGTLLFVDLFSGNVLGYSTTTGENLGTVPGPFSPFPISDVSITANGIFATVTDFSCVVQLAPSSQIVAGICSSDGQRGYSGDGGPATSADLNFPSSLAVDDAGNIFIADTSNNRIRKVDTNGIITTVAGDGSPGYTGDGGLATGANLNAPLGVGLYQGELFIADTGNNVVRQVDGTGVITTVAGNGTAGFSGDGGPAVNAMLNGPVAVALDSNGNLFVADTNNDRVREVTIHPAP
jgi:sugar lactone lactonase YvrE